MLKGAGVISGGRWLVVAKPSQALGLDEIAFGVPARIHQSAAGRLTKAHVAFHISRPTERLRDANLT